MDGLIASATWDACETCKHSDFEEGCGIPTAEISVHYDMYQEGFVCDDYDDVEE